MKEKKTCVVFHQGKLKEEREKATEKKKKKKAEKRDQKGRENYSMATS